MMYALIGEKLGHSYSPLIHSYFGIHDYKLFSMPPSELESFFAKRNFKGISVTIPYKKSVIPYLDEISPEAEKIGSINTVVNRDGRLVGYNTDYFGFLYTADHAGIELTGKNILILGSGGACAAVKAACGDRGAASVKVVSRKGEINYGNIYDLENTQVIINTTPVGMYPDNGERIVDPGRFPACEGVIDLIYNPLYTGLLLDAGKLGIKTANGFPMLVAQAKYASDIFRGIRRDDSVIEEALKKALSVVSNLVLVGMPGCGKSTVGRSLSAMLCRKVLDTDAIIEKKTGHSIPWIFDKEGESSFRDTERAVIESVGKEKGYIISTGGGSVLDEKNVDALRQNGIVVFLERDLKKLAIKGRPLSRSGKLDEMYAARLPFYKKASDITVKNNYQADDTALNILTELGWL